MAPPLLSPPVILWELRAISGNLVRCVLSSGFRVKVLTVAIADADIVLERFRTEAEAQKFAQMLYEGFISQGCTPTSKRDS